MKSIKSLLIYTICFGALMVWLSWNNPSFFSTDAQEVQPSRNNIFLTGENYYLKQFIRIDVLCIDEVKYLYSAGGYLAPKWSKGATSPDTCETQKSSTIKP